MPVGSSRCCTVEGGVRWVLRSRSVKVSFSLFDSLEEYGQFSQYRVLAFGDMTALLLVNVSCSERLRYLVVKEGGRSMCCGVFKSTLCYDNRRLSTFGFLELLVLLGTCCAWRGTYVFNTYRSILGIGSYFPPNTQGACVQGYFFLARWVLFCVLPACSRVPSIIRSKGKLEGASG
ncbi:hypothetical protein PM082_021645 [Marasmius tenuissimus]|nr:hypothetical protein PM082_021645 [Marasmius tenuissimus]